MYRHIDSDLNGVLFENKDIQNSVKDLLMAAMSAGAKNERGRIASMVDAFVTDYKVTGCEYEMCHLASMLRHEIEKGV